MAFVVRRWRWADRFLIVDSFINNISAAATASRWHDDRSTVDHPWGDCPDGGGLPRRRRSPGPGLCAGRGSLDHSGGGFSLFLMVWVLSPESGFPFVKCLVFAFLHYPENSQNTIKPVINNTPRYRVPTLLACCYWEDMLIVTRFSMRY